MSIKLKMKHLCIIYLFIFTSNYSISQEEVKHKFKLIEDCSYIKKEDGKNKYLLTEKFKEKLSFIRKEHLCRDNKEACKSEVNDDLNELAIRFKYLKTNEADEITIDQEIKNLGSATFEAQITQSVALDAPETHKDKLQGLKDYTSSRVGGSILATNTTRELIDKGTDAFKNKFEENVLWSKVNGFKESAIVKIKSASTPVLGAAKKGIGKAFTLGVGTNIYGVAAGAAATTLVNLVLKKPELKVLGDCPSECESDANKTSNICDDRSSDIEYKLFEDNSKNKKCIPILRYGNGHKRLMQLSEPAKAELLFIDPLFCQHVHDLHNKYKSERKINLTVKSCPKDFDPSIKIDINDKEIQALIGDKIVLQTEQHQFTSRFTTKKMFFPHSPKTKNDATINWISYNGTKPPQVCLLGNESSCLELQKLYLNELNPGSEKLNTAQAKRYCLSEDACYNIDLLSYENVAKTNVDNITKNFKGSSRYQFYAKNAYIFDHLFTRTQYEIETCCALLNMPNQQQFMSKHCTKFGPIFDNNSVKVKEEQIQRSNGNRSN